MWQGFFVFPEWELITTFSIHEGIFKNGDLHGPFLFSPCYHVMSRYMDYYMTLFWVNHDAFQVVQLLTFGSENSFNNYVICCHLNRWYLMATASVCRGFLCSWIRFKQARSVSAPLLNTVSLQLLGEPSPNKYICCTVMNCLPSNECRRIIRYWRIEGLVYVSRRGGKEGDDSGVMTSFSSILERIIP